MKGLLVAAALLAGGGLWAQEPDRDFDPDAARPYELRVLRHPYEIASFYRQSDGYGYADVEYPSARATASPYDVAQFYRSSGGSGYGHRAYGWPWRAGRSYGRRLERE